MCHWKFYLCILALIIVGNPGKSTPQENPQSPGLHFIGQGFHTNKRTSLKLFPQQSFKTSNHFSVEFELSFEKNCESYFGYIFRMINNDDTNIDLVYNQYDSLHSVSLIIGEKEFLMSLPVKLDYLYNWNTVKLDFDLIKNTYKLKVGEYETEKNGTILPLHNDIKIFFGVNHERGIETIDLPNMKIRDVIVSQNYTIAHHWPLNNMEGNICEDIISQSDAYVINPFWLYQNHIKWQLAYNVKLNGYANISFYPPTNRFFIMSSDSLINFDAGIKDDYAEVKFESPINFECGQNFLYDGLNQKLLRYSADQKLIAHYNFEENMWSKDFPIMPQRTAFWQHNKFLRTNDTCLYIFDGYGHYTFRNDLQTVNILNEKWKVKKIDNNVFSPRYLAGLGANYAGDTIYILGGYGSLHGDQSIRPNYSYDLIRFTPSTSNFKKLFSYDELYIKDFCFANSIIIQGDVFYALGFSKFEYNNHLQLYRGSLKSDTLEPVGKKIPFSFHDISTFIDLFYSKHEEKLFATISSLNDTSQTDIKIYALNFPPRNAVIQPKNIWSQTVLYIIFGGILITAIVVFIILKKRKKKNVAENNISLSKTKNKEKLTDKKQVAEVAEQQETELTLTALMPKSKIMLFGGFQIIDNNGTDITGKLTPLLKEMFLLIYLNSSRNGKGVTSKYISNLLWSDKPEKDARNNRSVNMSRLKSLISNVGNCVIQKEAGYWKINFDYSNVHIDYEILNNIIDDFTSEKEQILKIIEITRNKPFLKNINREWLDTFRADNSNNMVDTLINWAVKNLDNYEPSLIIKLTDTVFELDPINEEAMELKCKSLSKLGKHSLAKKAYDAFVKEYELLYGEKYKLAFNEVIK